jgi:hypothetical protein
MRGDDVATQFPVFARFVMPKRAVSANGNDGTTRGAIAWLSGARMDC